MGRKLVLGKERHPAACVQVGQTTLKGRPDKRNLRPPHHISPSLSHFDPTLHLTFHYKSIKSIQNQFEIRCLPL